MRLIIVLCFCCLRSLHDAAAPEGVGAKAGGAGERKPRQQQWRFDDAGEASDDEHAARHGRNRGRGADDGRSTSQQRAAAEMCSRAFDRFDLNGDGYISFEELKTVFEELGRDATDDELRLWIRSRDRSGRGKVSFADFQAFFEAYELEQA